MPASLKSWPNTWPSGAFRVESKGSDSLFVPENKKVLRGVWKIDARALCFKCDFDTMRVARDAQAIRQGSAQPPAGREGESMSSVVTKSDLVQLAAKAGNVSKAAAGEAVNAVFDAIVTNVAKGKRVTVIGFGTFLPRKRKARAGRSPANGKEIRIAAKTIPAFAAGQGFKEAVGKR
jgi:DNA-binding protein HU-beta